MSEALTKYEPQSIQALRAPDNMGQLQDMLGNRAPHFISSIIGLFATNTQLAQCVPESVVIAAMQGAAMDLSFDPNIGEAYMVPYNKKIDGSWVKVAQYQPGYKGLIQLALRTKQYKKLGAQAVTRQAFNALRQRVESSREDPAHTTIKFFEMLDFYPEFKDGRIYGYIAYFELLNGFPKFVFWTQEQCLTHAKKYSKQQDKQGNLYGSWVDSQDAMCIKTVLRQLFKWGPKSKEMRTSLELDSVNTTSDYDRLELETGAPKRLGHEDEDLFGDEPSHPPVEQLEKAYIAIEGLTGEEHPNYSRNSCLKWLKCETVRECTDIGLLRKYYAHKKEQRERTVLNDKPVEFTVEQLDDMMKAVEEKSPDKLDDFVNAADSKLYAVCQRIYEEAQKEV